MPGTTPAQGFRVPVTTDDPDVVDDMIYARGKEFHLPDEICSMALCYRLVSKRAIPAQPVVIPGDHGPTFIEEEMKQNKDAQRKPGAWVVGSVQNKQEQVAEEIDLMV